MKLVPKKDWQAKVSRAQQIAFQHKVEEMIANPETAAEIEVPPGFFDMPQHETLRTKWMDHFELVPDAPKPAKKAPMSPPAAPAEETA